MDIKLDQENKALTLAKKEDDVGVIGKIMGSFARDRREKTESNAENHEGVSESARLEQGPSQFARSKLRLKVN